MAEANRVSTLVTQNSSGFSRGVCVRFDGTNWVRATTGQAGVGIVGSMMDSNTFEFVQMGELDGLDGLTPGAVYYPDSSGNLSVAPNGASVGIAYTDRTLFVGAPASVTAAIDLAGYATLSDLQAAIATAILDIQAGTTGLVILASETPRDAREAIQIEDATQTLVYTGDLLTSLSDSYGTKTFSYDVDDRLTGIVGTGMYRSKTFAYTGDQLTSITVL